jgi:hypothetical protein
MNGGDLEVRIDLGVDAHELALLLEIVEALAEGLVTHGPRV